MKWREIDGESFSILYPTGMESEAQRMANVLNGIIDRVSFSYHKKPRKISIILQNQTTTSNGFVQLAPRRSEFFTTPAQEFDYQDWLNSLAVHELRHVVQFDRLTGKLKAPLFEELAFAIFGITLPPWFFEGDAVGIETSLTTAGRGRQPEFDLILRTNTLSGKKYSYSKNYLGSIKNFPPGYYQLGYYMTTKLRRDYGAGIMDTLMRRMARNPIRPYNLSNSIKKYTGMTTRGLHDSTISELAKKWKDQQTKAAPFAYPILTKRKDETPTNYLMPVAVSPNKILALREGKANVSAVVMIDTLGHERELFKTGIQEEPHFRYAAGKIVWEESRFHARFHKRAFNVINIYDLETHRAKQLTHKSRLFAPTLSADGKLVAAIEVSHANAISLVEFDALTGKELKRYGSPENCMLQTPSFNVDGNTIIVTGVTQKGKTFYELNRAGGKFKQLIPFQEQLLSRPVYAGNLVVFKAHYNGIDNLYKLDPASKKITQLTSVKFGAYNPSFDTGSATVLFNNYQVNGQDISSVPLNASAESTSSSLNYIQPVVQQEGSKDVFADIPTRKYDSKPYSELKHLFYFHSILPVAEENEFFDDYNFGLKIQSDNKLNTMSFYTGWDFNNALRQSEYFAGITYSKFFPIVNVKYLNQPRLTYYRQSANGPLIPLSFRENVTEATISIPLQVNRFNSVYSMGIEAGTSYTSRYEVSNRPGNFLSSIQFPMEYRVYANRNSLRNPRNLAPKWGQNLSLKYSDLTFDKNLSGKLLVFRSTFYFPGIFTNHSFSTSFNYQNGDGSYNFTVDIPRVSGYSNLRPTAGLRNTLVTNYRFPICYPDVEIGPLAYIKRLSGGFFADFENIGKGAAFAPRTYGAEVKADLNALRFFLPNFNVGGRLILVNEKPKQNPILALSLSYSY